MSRSLDTLLRPSLLAVAIALCTPLVSPLLMAAQQASVVAYDLPAGPLATTLNQISSQGGLALSLDPALVAGKTSAAVKGISTLRQPCVRRCVAAACNWCRAAPGPTR